MQTLSAPVTAVEISVLGPIAPTPGLDAWDYQVGLPDLSTPQACFDYGHALGRETFQPLIPDTTPPALIDWIWKGWDLGLEVYRARIDEEAAEAIEAASPTDAEVAEGIAPWAARPTPEALAAGLRAILARIDDEGAAGELARAALESAAGDVELFRATTWGEIRAREWEMAETAFGCPTCG